MLSRNVLVKVRLEVGVGDSVVRGLNRILYRIYLEKQANALWCLIEISPYSELSLDLGGCKFKLRGNYHTYDSGQFSCYS